MPLSGGDEGEPGATHDQIAVCLDLDFFTSTYELPPIDRAAGKAQLNAAVPLQVSRTRERWRRFEIVWRTDHDMPLLGADRNGHHVLGNEFGKSDTTVETLGGDIDEPTFADDLHFHFGIAMQEVEHNRRQALFGGCRIRVDA